MDGRAPHFEVEDFADPVAALARVCEIYDLAVGHLRRGLQHYVDGADVGRHVRACYPLLRVRTDTVARADSRLSYGFVAGPGVFETSLTRPDLFADYYLEQFRLLVLNHGVALAVGSSTQPIPVHFALPDHDYLEGHLGPERRRLLRDHFDLPDLGAMDDGIANGTFEPGPGEPHPLSLFTAPRVDYSLHRLRHYTGTRPAFFQNFVLFTNYQFYIDEFIRLGHGLMTDTASGHGYEAFVEPGNWPALLPCAVDAVVDACDQVRAKAAIATWARASGTPLVAAGAAGGKRAPERVEVADLSAATHDPLLASRRARLRRAHAAPRHGPIGVACVFSREPMTRPVAGDCAVDVAPGAALACHGYGSSVAVTATFGMVAAGWVLQALQAARAAGDMASRAGAGRSRA